MEGLLLYRVIEETGLRAAEVGSLQKYHFNKLKDPNFKGMRFVGKVKSKGGEWRNFVLISDKIKELLRKILFDERKEAN